jgi:hypothetical protein
VPITIDVGGVLALPAAATGIGVAVENNGTISTLAGNAETVIALLALPNVTGGGVIELAENVTLNAEAKLSVQDVKIGAGKTLIAHSIATPFSSTTEKRIINEGTLTLPAAVTSVGVGVINKGTVRTAATEELAAVLDKINKEDAVNTIELTSPITAATPVSIVSAGTVEFSNAAAPVFGVGSSIKAATIEFKDGLKSPATDGTVTLDAAEVIIPANKTILFGGAAGTITLAAGTEVVASTGGTVLLKADGGKAELKGVATTVVTASTGGLAISAGASTFGGPVSFAGTLAVSGGAVIFDGPVAFSDDLTLSGIAATFNGNVSVVKQKAIVLSDTSSSVRLGAGVYLGLPAAAGVPAVYKSVIYNPSEVATEVVVLTAAAANTKLTFGDSSENPPRLITQANSGTGAHGITITGKASLPAGATYTVASEANNVGTLSLGTNAELSLAAGYLVSADEDKANGLTTASPSSKLALIGASGTNGAILAGAGKVIAGGSTIVGGTNGWQAVDSNSSTVPVTISVDKIESDASTTALTAVTGTSQPSITVAAAGTLTIAGNTEIALAGDSSAVGSIVLKYGTTGAKIVFAAAGAKISTSLTSGTTAVTATIAGGITANGGTVGTSLTVTSTAATGNSLKLGSITPTSSSPTFNGAANVITGPTSTADTTINSTLTVTAAA